MEINIKEVKEELEQKNLLDVHNALTKDRRIRRFVLSHLLTAIILTFMYGTLENPFQYTLSRVGNGFSVGYRVFFIVWSVYVGFTFFASVYAMFRLEEYKNSKRDLIITFIAWMFFIATALIPSVPELPIAHVLHIITAIIFSVMMFVGTIPFYLHVARENPRLRKNIHIWVGITIGGGVFWYIAYGNKGMYELWFIIVYLLLTLYIAMMLFEESIMKKCISILRDEEDLNLGIEKAYAKLTETKK